MWIQLGDNIVQGQVGRYTDLDQDGKEMENGKIPQTLRRHNQPDLVIRMSKIRKNGFWVLSMKNQINGGIPEDAGRGEEKHHEISLGTVRTTFKAFLQVEMLGKWSRLE